VGRIHLGITGDDLIRENISDAVTRIGFVHKLGFGFADVVVAVPACWIDVSTVADLEDIAMPFRRRHGRWPRVATKYMNLTRRFFASKGFGDYRIVESACNAACQRAAHSRRRGHPEIRGEPVGVERRRLDAGNARPMRRHRRTPRPCATRMSA